MVAGHPRHRHLFVLTICSLITSLVLAGCSRSPAEIPVPVTPETETLPAASTSDKGVSTTLQDRNDLPKTQLQPKRSPELEDNHIGVGLGTYYKENVPIPSPFYFDSYGDDPELVYSLGFKWIRIAFDDWVGDPLDWQNVEVEPGWYLIKPESEITGDNKLSGKTYPATHPSVDEVISDYANNNITIVLNLGVGTGGNHLDSTRFKTFVLSWPGRSR